MRVLVVKGRTQRLPEGAAEKLRRTGCTLSSADDFKSAMRIARGGEVDAVVATEPDPSETRDAGFSEFSSFLRLLDAQRIAAIVLADAALTPRPSPSSLVDIVGRDVSADELCGRLAMIDRYHGTMRRLEQEVRNMSRLGKQLNHHFREVDQELRLAGKLQRDFLPDLRRPIHNLQFASVYRPASWVSGDMFDVFRIDEEHTGVYLADAVGHGLAASLLTMYIKRAILPKRITDTGYTIVSPSEIISTLNDVLTDHALPNSQFVTACYGLFNHRTRTLEYARGGHPYPMLISRGGIGELKTSGGLLGLFKGEEFPTLQMTLDPGDKVIFFTDGVELAFQKDDGSGLDTTSYQRFIEQEAGTPIGQLMNTIDERLNLDPGSLNPRDDITLVGFEVLGG
ncbi:MAG: SpoIIE family protein phosphatase [Planctomycetota bacterium]